MSADADGEAMVGKDRSRLACMRAQMGGLPHSGDRWHFLAAHAGLDICRAGLLAAAPGLREGGLLVLFSMHGDGLLAAPLSRV